MIYRKIALAIDYIKQSSLKKEGENTFSKYKYYTPEQVSKLVHDACKANEITYQFNLVRNEFGIEGKMTIIDLTSDNEDDGCTFTMASAIPEIKATNIAQQIGGAMTYTKRYMLMNIFDIVDNNLDFDTTENTKKQAEPVKQTSEQKEEKIWLTEAQYDAAMKSDTKGITATLNAFSKGNKTMKTEYRINLTAQLKKLTENN